MHELLTQIYNHVRMAWRYRWLALTVTVVVSLVGSLSVMALPDTYKVSAKLYLDTQSLLRPALRGLALESSSGLEALALLRRTLLVRPNLEEIARATDLDLQATTPVETERMLERLRSNISISQTRRENIFTISYEDNEAQLAKRVVDAVLNLFLERSLGAVRRGTVATQEFLDKQIKEYEAKLIAAEERLKDFKARNMGFLPGATSDFVSKREALAQTLQDARLQLQEAQNRRNEMKRQLEDSSDLHFVEDLPSPLDGRIQQLESRVDELLLRYTERHPDVVIARGLIDDLKAQKQAQIESITEEGQVDANNPIYQGLKVALSSADAEVAGLAVRAKEYETRLTEVDRLIDQSLKVEAEYARLNRDYGVLQRNYQGFVSRREQAEIGSEAEQTGENLQVRIIEPPRVPVLPTGPKRNLLSIAVLVLGIGVGAALAWLLSLINPVFFDVRQMASTLERPILGTMSFSGLKTMAQPRAEVITFALAFVVVLAAYGGFIVLSPLDSDMLRSFPQLLDKVL